MALPLFEPSLEPSSQGTSSGTQIKQRRTALGDGYEQRAADGLNYISKNHRLVWNRLRQAEAATIVAFLTTNAIGGFRYAFPGDSVRQWSVVGDIADSPDTVLTRRVEVDVKEIFDP